MRTRRALGVGGLLLVGALALVSAPNSPRAAAPPPSRQAVAISAEAYREVVRRTASMVADGKARKLAANHKLDVLNITWEDTGRFENSAVGPNISDMSIQVLHRHPKWQKVEMTCMPVIRYPNFRDQSADVRTDKFFLLVGNEKDLPLRRVSLKQFLGNVRLYMSSPKSWKGDQTSLLAKRDTHVLVSAQACFLPVPRHGMAEFNPVLFNYPSRRGDPGVLAILATREGTSMTIIDNARDTFRSGGAWGQRLFFNKDGDRASLTGQRLSDFKAGKGKPDATPKDTESVGLAKQAGLNMVLLIQVPLKQKAKPRPLFDDKKKSMEKEASDRNEARRSDVEEAVIGHGKVEGPFTEMDGLAIERDPRFPVRVTVQFYKATSNGVVSEDDVKAISDQIKKVYSEADFVGSLVTDGRSGRPTDHDADRVEPQDWWDNFWKQFEKDTGKSRADVIAEIREVRGSDWVPLTEHSLAEEAQRMAFPERAWLGQAWEQHHKSLLIGAGVALALIVVGVILRARTRSAQAN